jgi:NADP-dependent 3-hydroxy acid dehydrogenase YdfG
MPGTLADKIALVTGGSTGIGKASTIIFAREAAKVVVADINIDGGEETARVIRPSGGDAVFVKADVSRAAEVEAMVNKAVATYRRLDCSLKPWCGCAPMLPRLSLAKTCRSTGVIRSRKAMFGRRRP